MQIHGREGSPRDAVHHLVEAYHELNPAVIDEHAVTPTPLQFMRYVASNRPFVVRRAACEWPAVRRWNSEYLRRAMDGKSVNVAITPTGNADGLVEDQSGSLILVEPHETQEVFSDFLDYIQADSQFTEQERVGRNVKYAQTQNDNLRDEYTPLQADVPKDIDFASVGLDLMPDAVNFWLGNERSVTALHKDNYENIYVQIRGQKHFVLLPPSDMPCVNEVPTRFGRYRPTAEDEPKLEPELYEGDNPVPTPIWDPDEPEARTSQYSHLSRPLRVTLNEGDMMYLPAMWYHKVAQSCGDEDYSCSVNYWYDMSFDGHFWAQNCFLRETVEAAAKQVQYPELSMDDQE